MGNLARVTDPTVISLIRKRAELAGEVQKAQAHLDRLLADLAAVDRVLDITGFDRDPETIPAKTRGSLRERDEALRVREFARDMLSKAPKPLRASPIALAYMAETGVAGADPRTVEFYRYKVVNALRSMRRKGEAEMIGKCMGATWRLVVRREGGPALAAMPFTVSSVQPIDSGALPLMGVEARQNVP